MWKALACSREWKPFLAAGALVGVVGVGVFGLVHAVIIVPIWSKLLGGIPFGVGAGLVMGWAFWELRSGGRWRATAGGGFAFGLLMWVTLIPMTAFGAVVRATGIHGGPTTYGRPSWSACWRSCTGVLSGCLIGRRWRAALAAGCAVLGLALAMGGPIPVTNSARALWLFAAFAGVYALCGLVLALIVSAIAGPLRSPA